MVERKIWPSKSPGSLNASDHESVWRLEATCVFTTKSMYLALVQGSWVEVSKMFWKVNITVKIYLAAVKKDSFQRPDRRTI
jgi:hypothetical protein